MFLFEGPCLTLIPQNVLHVELLILMVSPNFPFETIFSKHIKFEGKSLMKFLLQIRNRFKIQP